MAGSGVVRDGVDRRDAAPAESAVAQGSRSESGRPRVNAGGMSAAPNTFRCRARCELNPLSARGEVEADLGHQGDERAAGHVDEHEAGTPEGARVDVEADHAHGARAGEAAEEQRDRALHGVGQRAGLGRVGLPEGMQGHGLGRAALRRHAVL